MNTIWTFGCSFTAEYDPIEGLHHPYENTFDKYKKYRGGKLPKTWPTILSEKLNYNIMNCAQGGSSNYRIFNQFTDVCDMIKKNDILIFGWTSMLRFRIANLNEDIFNEILPNNTNVNLDGISKNTLDEIVLNRSHKIWTSEIKDWIRLINTFSNEIGAHVFHWTSDDSIFDQYSDFIDEKRYILVDESNNESSKTNILGYFNLPMFYGGVLKGRISEETEGEILDDHLGEFGHKVQAEYFYNHIKKFL